MPAIDFPRARRAFTMIEVLTVGAIALVIFSLSLATLGWMADAREREQVQEGMGAQLMAARAYAVQYRTYAGVQVRNVPASQCGRQRSGIIRMIHVQPADVNTAPTAANQPAAGVWRNYNTFFWVFNRSPIGIPTGVGCATGTRTAFSGTPATDIAYSNEFFVIFGPDGVLRPGWEVRRVYTTTNLNNLVKDYTNDATFGGPAPNRFSVNSFIVYDDFKLRDEQGNDDAALLLRLYNAANQARNDILCRRTFVNPYTGLGVNNYDFDP